MRAKLNRGKFEAKTLQLEKKEQEEKEDEEERGKEGKEVGSYDVATPSSRLPGK